MVFAGGAKSRRWGRAGPSPRRLAQPAPGPAGDIFKITGPSPTRYVRSQFHATWARPRQRVCNLTGRLPGLVREILRIVLLFLRAVSPRRGFEAATCSLVRTPRLLWGVARSLQLAYEAESAMPLYRPSDTVCAVWVTQCLDQAYIEPRQNVSNHDFIFFKQKLKKKRVVNRDKKKHDS